MARTVLTKLLSRMGERAGIKDVYLHRFQHTFAITYLRNESDLFHPAGLLDHTGLAMVNAMREWR
jgi:integrase/recombinase XerD